MWPFNKKKTTPPSLSQKQVDRLPPYLKNVVDGGYFDYYENMDGEINASLRWEDMILDLGLPSKHNVDYARECENASLFLKVFAEIGSGIYRQIKEPTLSLGKTVLSLEEDGNYSLTKSVTRGLAGEDGQSITEWELLFTTNELTLSIRNLIEDGFDVLIGVAHDQPFIIEGIDYKDSFTYEEKALISYVLQGVEERYIDKKRATDREWVTDILRNINNK